MDLFLITYLLVTFPFLVTFFLIKMLRTIAPNLGLLDIPNKRKQHTGIIPLIGGIAIYCGVLLTSLLMLPFETNTIIWLLMSCIIVILGVIDDARKLSVYIRLMVQSIATLILIYSTGLYLQNLGDIFGMGTLNISFLGYLVTIAAVIGSINAFNMIDGIDGLSGILSGITFSSLGLLFFLNNDQYGYLIAAIFCISLIPYLQSNLKYSPENKKIFMGDAGSMFIGFTVVWLLIYGTQGENTSFNPVTALWVIALPLMDMSAVMIRRARRGQSPMQGDRDHLHHILMRIGFSNHQTLIIISALAGLFAATGVSADILGVKENIMFFGFIGLFIIYHYILQYIENLMKIIRKFKRVV
jgi:UDP-GlcNAc:undecaprenyl-phosphate GlcNAc-1-phosphate transferase